MLSVSPLISASPLAAVSLTREVPALAGRNEPLKLMRCMMARTATGDSRIASNPESGITDTDCDCHCQHGGAMWSADCSDPGDRDDQRGRRLIRDR